MNSWTKQLLPIIKEFSNNDSEPLDGDDVDRLCYILKLKINLHQGNITQNEYDRTYNLPRYIARSSARYDFNYLDLASSLRAYAARRKIDWNILETVKFSKGGKLIVNLELLEDIDPYDDKECVAVNVLKEFKELAINKANI